MVARLAVSTDRVTVSIRYRLGYDCWEVMREARHIAQDRHLALHLEFDDCVGGDMGGLGALLLVQHYLGQVNIVGCNHQFVRWFNSIGVCAHCVGGDACRSRAAVCGIDRAVA